MAERPTVDGRVQRVGPVEKDRSNGEDAGGDGNPMRIDGVAYDKGLGGSALSVISLDLGGRCTTFRSDVRGGRRDRQ
ncbi:conserved hypothetical protein [Micromonospora lupini str. Lupac 08]|uniref:Glycosyl hydrolase family 98 putative carbohydrate-binding module domain-containing protein n=1 Tax=Micromonospora lupini str. Lupac 08 TaxID=1150864 RepID=I0L202_9ACTN|nr:conserved hypothetical protein [Micromonospora lupini str. Lupac 08]